MENVHKNNKGENEDESSYAYRNHAIVGNVTVEKK